MKRYRKFFAAFALSVIATSTFAYSEDNETRPDAWYGREQVDAPHLTAGAVACPSRAEQKRAADFWAQLQLTDGSTTPSAAYAQAGHEQVQAARTDFPAQKQAAEFWAKLAASDGGTAYPPYRETTYANVATADAKSERLAVYCDGMTTSNM